MINLFDEEQIMKSFKHEMVAEGRAEGRTDDVKLLLKAGLSPEFIANSLNMPLAEVAALKG